MSSTIATVCKKEVLETLRDRRTIISLLIGMLIGPLLFMVMMNVMVSRNLAALEETLDIAMPGAESAPNLIAFLNARGIHSLADHGLDGLDAAAAAVRSGARDVVLVIDGRFAEDFGTARAARVTLIFDRSNQRDSRRADRVRSVLGAYGQQIGALRLLASGGDPGLLRPLLVDDYDVSTPAGRSVLMLGVLTYFLLFAILTGGLHLAIDGTAGERERKSLEPLLTLPISRTQLLVGKMAATICYMLMSLALSIAAFALALQRMPLEQVGMSSSFGFATALAAFAVLAPFAPLGAALMTILSSFAKTYREAQTYVTFVLLVPTLPVLFASMLNVAPSLKLMWIPSLSQHLLVTTLIKGEPLVPLYIALSAGSTLALGVLCGWIATRLYRREAILG
jgi:sodium transport system permease protein